MFQECFKNVLRVFQECFKSVMSFSRGLGVCLKFFWWCQRQLDKVYDDGDDIFEKVSDDVKDILEKVSEDGDDKYEKVSI